MMSGLIRVECGNADSCAPGTAHNFPEEGTRMAVTPGVDLRMVGSEDTAVAPVEPVRVIGIDAEAHQVMAVAGGVRVWVTTDDITGVVDA